MIDVGQLPLPTKTKRPKEGEGGASCELSAEGALIEERMIKSVLSLPAAGPP